MMDEVTTKTIEHIREKRGVDVNNGDWKLVDGITLIPLNDLNDILDRIRDLETTIETALAVLKSSRFVNAEPSRAMGVLGNAVNGTEREAVMDRIENAGF